MSMTITASTQASRAGPVGAKSGVAWASWAWPQVLPRVDFTDAYAVACGPLPADPQVWADAVFRDLSPWRW